MATINPFFRPTRSNPMSAFVDQSLPMNAIMQAGLAKQKQQDVFNEQLGKLLAYDQNALQGGDTTYLDEQKKGLADFSQEMFMKDLTDPAAQLAVFKRVSGLRNDKKLKQIQANYDAVQKLKADAADLYKKGKRFEPSYQQSMSQIQDYVQSGRQGEDIGALGVQEALNLQTKKESYVNNMKASGGENFINDYKDFQDMYFKQGWAGVTGGRIKQQIENAIPDYAASSEGQQDLALYRYQVASGNVPTDMRGNPINSGTEYLRDRLLRTGSEFIHGKGTISYAKGLTGDLKAKEDAKRINVSPGQEIPQAEFDLDEAKEELADPTVSPIKKQILQSVKNQAENKVAKSKEGQALEQQIQQTAAAIPQLKPGFSTTNNFDKTRYGNLKGDALDKVENFLIESMPKVIQEKVAAKDADFFTDMSSLVGVTDDLVEVVTDPDGNTSLGIKGTDYSISAEELGLAPNALANKPSAIKALNTNMKRVFNENTFLSDNADLLATEVAEYKSMVDATANGTPVQIGNFFWPDDEKTRTAVEQDLRNINPNNLEVVNPSNLEEQIEPEELSNYIANIGTGNVSVRLGQGNRMLEITARLPKESGEGHYTKTFLATDKKDLGREEGIDAIYRKVTQDPLAGSEADAAGRLPLNTTNDFQPISQVYGPLGRVILPPAAQNIKIKLNEGNTGGSYILGNDQGSYTVADLMNIATSTTDPNMLTQAKNIFLSQAASNNISSETAAEMFDYAVNYDPTKLSVDNDAELLSLIGSLPLTATSEQEVTSYAKLLSLIK